MRPARRLAAIAFTDLAGFTSQTQRDEAGALRMLEQQNALVEELLVRHGGRQVKSMGDGLLLEFPNALSAVEWALDLQRTARERAGPGTTGGLRLRIGVHLGDVEERGSDILGDAVNIASRIEPLADVGGVCVSEQVFAQVHNKIDRPFEKLPRPTLKGVRDPVDVYRVVAAGPPTRVPGTSPVASRLAVLPLSNISPDPHDEFFADGLTEELIAVLSRLRGLRVVSRTSVNQYRNTTKPVAQIADELGVDCILEGSVRKAGDQLRITVQLIDAHSDEHRWAQTYDHRLENVFAIQADVAEKTASALQVELLSTERRSLGEKPTSDMAAYESYLRGVQSARKALDEMGAGGSDADAVSHFERAIELDPQFAAAQAHLANHLVAMMGITRSPREVAPRVRDLVSRALALDPRSSEAHAARGNLLMQVDWEWELAEEEFRTAIALNPSNSAAHNFYGLLLLATQRFEEARVQQRELAELEPSTFYPQFQQALSYESEGNFPEALRIYLRLVEEYPTLPAAHESLAYIYAEMGRVADAERALNPPGLNLAEAGSGFRPTVLSLIGQHEETRAALAQLEERAKTRYLPLLRLAWAHALLGDREEAIALIEKEFRDDTSGLWASYLWPGWDEIRDDPRFVALLRRMKVPTTIHRPSLTAQIRGTG